MHNDLSDYTPSGWIFNIFEDANGAVVAAQNPCFALHQNVSNGFGHEAE